jgi:hypothetical protein
MEIFILVAVLFVLWTNEVLLGKKLFEEKPDPTPDDKLADAIKAYLNKGIKIRDK